MIGVVYAVSSAAAVLLADRSPHGAEHLRGMLVGSILSVRASEVLKVDSTPTFFINGEKIKGETSIEEFEKKINPLLKS